MLSKGVNALFHTGEGYVILFIFWFEIIGFLSFMIVVVNTYVHPI